MSKKNDPTKWRNGKEFTRGCRKIANRREDVEMWEGKNHIKVKGPKGTGTIPSRHNSEFSRGFCKHLLAMLAAIGVTTALCVFNNMMQGAMP